MIMRTTIIAFIIRLTMIMTITIVDNNIDNDKEISNNIDYC